MNNTRLTDLIAPDAMERYLALHGWTLKLKMRNGVTQWERGKHRVLVPPDPELSDYRWLLARVLATVADVEKRSQESLASEIVEPDSDLLRVIVEENVERATVPLPVALAALSTVREFVMGATRTVATRAGLSRRRISEVVDSYGDAVGIGQTESGSYVVPVVLPIEVPKPLPAPADQSSGYEPIGRQITLTLAESLRAVSDAAKAHAHPDDWWIQDPFAIAGLRDAIGMKGGRTVRFAFTWSPAIKPPRQELRGPVVFGEEDLSSLTTWVSDLPFDRDRAAWAAERWLARGEAVERLPEALKHVDVTGPVITLSRPRVTLRGRIEGQVRSIWVYLEPAQYQSAIDAHATDRPVRVRGVLRLKGRATPRFVEIELFEVL